jgi:hypothetical protein
MNVQDWEFWLDADTVMAVPISEINKTGRTNTTKHTGTYKSTAPQ